MEICITVFNCGIFLILENKVIGIHFDKATIYLTSYNALVSRKLNNQSSIYYDIVAKTTQAEARTNQAAASLKF